jgi:hypothetical protein
MINKVFGVFVILLLFINYSKSQVSIGGEIRPRSEYRQGYKKPLLDTLKPAFITFQRTRLSFNYKSQIFTTHISIQDARIWGESLIKESESKMEVFEAWAECTIDSNVLVKFGRQSLIYDDQRLFSSGEWNNGNAHDLLLIKYEPSKLYKIHGGLAYNNSIDSLMNVNYSLTKMYKALGFIWVSKSFSNGLKITAIAIDEGLQKKNDYKVVYSRFTGGGNIDFQNDSSRFGLHLLAYYQKGKSWSFLDLKAYMAAAKFSYKFYKSNSLFVGTDYYSGTKSDMEPGKTNTFNKLYGSNHSVNGNMEYWRNIPEAGLIDYYVGIYGQFTPKFSTNMTYHIFRFAQKYFINELEIDKNIGSEIDLELNYAVNEQIKLQAGYCVYFITASTKQYFGTNETGIYKPQWAYMMISVKPNFYKTPVLVEDE